MQEETPGENYSLQICKVSGNGEKLWLGEIPALSYKRTRSICAVETEQ